MSDKDIKRYQNPLDVLAECDNGGYVKCSDIEPLLKELKQKDDEIKQLRECVKNAYECGHNDTVESNYCDPHDRADEIIEEAKELLGYEIDTTELRLIPYAHHVMINNQKIDPNKINQEEREILSKWREKGFIEGGAGGLAVTKEFWDSMGEILFISYVDID